MNTFPRRTAAGCLIATAVLSAAWELLQPNLTGDPAHDLGSLHASGTATVAALLFALAQAPFLVGVAALAYLARPAAPRLAAAGAVLGFLGGFGHTVYAGVSFAELAMAGDPANYPRYVGVLYRIHAGPAAPLMAVGLLGTVLGLLTLATALWRAKVAPRWTAPALAAFVVVEFVGGAVSPYATYLAALLYLASLTAVATTTWTGTSGARVA